MRITEEKNTKIRFPEAHLKSKETVFVVFDKEKNNWSDLFEKMDWEIDSIMRELEGGK